MRDKSHSLDEEPFSLFCKTLQISAIGELLADLDQRKSKEK